MTESVKYAMSDLFAEMTGSRMLIAELLQLGKFLSADLPGVATAGVEVATVWTIDG